MDISSSLRGLSAVTMMALAAAALAAPAAAQDEAMPGEGKTIAVITPDYAAQPAAKEAIDLFMTEAQARGYDVSLTDTASDNAAINGEITTAVAQQVDAIVTAFGTPQEFGEGLADAAEAGVPVFGLDTGGVVEPTLVNVTTDPRFLGEASAQAIIDALGGAGKVAIIHFDPFEPVRLRAEAARALFEDNGIEIVEYVQGDPADSTGFAKATVLDLLVKYPEGDLDAVWAGWDASALGAFQATQEAGRPEVLVTGVDGQDFARAEVAKDLNWIATVRQDWPTIATTLADIIDAHFAGTDPAESTVFVPAVLITADNAE
ncbi:MAG TPA: substrate-binding domain-containing protein [Candidatus Limnocylindrales bacterium]|nr:substrate-binding domain-containing protein [Candidatus Limnocylindrales bacterium]